MRYIDKREMGRKSCPGHFRPESTPLLTFFCVGEKVEIKGKNCNPSWGLYNGAIGTVKEIVFRVGQNPNSKNLPAYVAVEFQSYKPPSHVPLFDNKNPKIVPIPMVTHTCSKPQRCCSVQVCPLGLSFARTIHSFQGQEAGPGNKFRL